MRPVGERLGELLGAEVQQAPAVVGAEVEELAAALEPGEVLLLENLRFEPGETENDPELARRAGGARATSTSTTPSAPPTAPTPAPRASPTSCPPTRACCSSAR